MRTTRLAPVIVGILAAAWWSPLGSQTQVANNAAELSGKIVMLADGGTARTVTNAFTFDRDPSAPFLVTSGSAVVTNLDADLFDGYQATAMAVLAETETISGAWTFSNALTDFTNASAVLRLSGTTGPRIFVGDTANANMTAGVTVNQGGSDDEIHTWKSSDVAHGITANSEADSFGVVRKASATDGGLQLEGYRDTGGNSGLILVARVEADPDTTKSTAGAGAIYVRAQKRSGTGTAAIGANTNLIVFEDGANTRFILDADGDSHQDVGTAWTNFDAYDDSLLLDSLSYFVSPPTDPIKARFASALESLVPRHQLQRAELVTFNADGHHFVNMSRLTMLLTGAVRQNADEMRGLKTRLATLEDKNRRLARQLMEQSALGTRCSLPRATQ